MVVAEIESGFGNQLFNYACAYALARRLEAKLILDSMLLSTNTLRNYELGALNLQYDKLLSIPKGWPYLLKVLVRRLCRFVLALCSRRYVEKKAYIFDESLLSLRGNWRLHGYWQSEKYFKTYRDEILAMLTPTYSMTHSFCKLHNEILSTNSVAVHVRRGDYVELGICLGESYYRDSVSFLCKELQSPTFYIFSDDIEYAKKLCAFVRDADVVPVVYDAHNSTIEDFLLMKSCKHNIIANSSYSWWAAWANVHEDKIVVAPKRENKDDFYPEEWIQVS